jgi:PAS domain-containing protein
MDSARRTLQAMRLDENRLLAERVQVDQAAVRRLQFVSVALAVAASGFLVWIFWLIAGTARRQRQGADTLRQANENLEAQVDASAADLRDSHARLRSIIDSAVDGIIVIDGHGRIEAFNPGAERLFGYPEPEVLGRNVKMLMPGPTAPSDRTPTRQRSPRARSDCGPRASLIANRAVLREPHRAAHGLIEAGQNPRQRVAFGDGAADHSAPDGM